MSGNHMSGNIHREIHEDLCGIDPERISFTRRAFELLPGIRRPMILDVGCGRGDPTLELARLTDGVITGVDLDQGKLIELSRSVQGRGLSKRVRALNCSMNGMPFPDETFDIIWAEASIHVVGFEQGLDQWRRFLRRKGFLVVHEMAWLRPDPPRALADRWHRVYPGIRTIGEYVAEIPLHGYDLTGHFALPDDFWWHHYYQLLEARIAALREKYGDDRDAAEQLEQEQEEVELHRKYPGWYGSAYFVMRKREPAGGPA